MNPRVCHSNVLIRNGITPTKYSSRCLKKNKNNLDIVVRQLLWKLEGLFKIVNMIHMCSHNGTINLHIRVEIVPALYDLSIKENDPPSVHQLHDKSLN